MALPTIKIPVQQRKAIIVHPSSCQELNNDLRMGWRVKKMQPFHITGDSMNSGSILVILAK